MKLLFLTPQLPYPPQQGTAIRNWGLIKHLAARHSITLLSFAETGQTVAPELREACARVFTAPAPTRTRVQRLRTLASPHADLARRLWSPDFAQQLSTLLRDTTFDAIQIEGLEMATYLSLLRPSSAVIVYDAHNAEFIIQRRALLNDLRQPARWPAALYSAVQVPRLRAFERAVCNAARAVSCVSAEDAAALQELVPALSPAVIPNGITVDEYTAIHRLPSAVRRLVFTGKMDYRPNVDAVLWFADEIWPRIRAGQPDVEFVVVGQKPTEAVRALHGRNGIHITGWVDDARPPIAEAAVYIAPLRMGGGTRFKLLEAMALARPIVSTRLGAEGFAVTPGREMLLADAPQDFAEAVLSVLNDSARAEALGQAGLRFVRGGYDWSAIVPKLEALYGAVATSNRAASATAGKSH